MKKINPLLPAALLSFALIACTQADPNNIAIDAVNNTDGMDVAAPAPGDNAAATAANSADDGFNLTSSKDGDTSAGIPILPDDAAKAVIPAQYLGRWGMVAADCTSTRGDAKGLITIAAKTIKFYEATATLKAQRPSIATSFSGLFGFTGEGQTWEKVETLTRTGDMLKRADKDGTFDYKRCS